MGVEFTCGDFEFRYSYSGLQEERKKWIEAAIRYLKSINQEEMWTEVKEDYHDEREYFGDCFSSEIFVVSTLEASLKNVMSFFSSPINYEVFTKIDKDALRFFGLVGLYYFVHHSDCEGCYSPGEALEMKSTFVKLRKFLNETEDDSYENMLKVFDQSINTGKIIRLH